MASYSVQPALYARSSNVRRNDQARYMAAKNYPKNAWDSLGIGLSEWNWNNRLGTEKWQDGVLMDICRGPMLLHIWSDNDIIAEDRPQMAEFIDLLKSSPECFKNPFPLNNPYKDDWWGYCCSDGKKAFIGINNGAFEDQQVNLSLNSLWGLPDGVEWDIYCWYPDHIRYQPSAKNAFGTNEKIIIRPSTAVLLEVVPRGHKPALKFKDWKDAEMPVSFSEKPRELEVKTNVKKSEESYDFSVKGQLPVLKTEGWLVVTTEFRRGDEPAFSIYNKPLSMASSLGGKKVEFVAALDNPVYSAPWQTYRLPVKKSDSEKKFSLNCTIDRIKSKLKDGDVDIQIRSHYIPWEIG